MFNPNIYSPQLPLSTTWTTLQTACRTSRRPSGMSLNSFINLGLEFCSHLTLHHNIEETSIFPALGKKMPAFRKGGKGNGLMVKQHKKIHDGLGRMEEYLKECKSGMRELRMKELGEIMDSFSEILWVHLDAEVKELGAENMRKYWTVQEVKKLGF